MNLRARVGLTAAAMACLVGVGCEHYDAGPRASCPENIMTPSSDRIGRGVFESPEVLARMQTRADETRAIAHGQVEQPE